MKVAYLLPGSGGSFYCGNCTRDMFLTQSLKKSGFDVMLIPMYLPLSVDKCTADSPIFYGAVNIYLEQLIPFFRRLPRWATHWLDSEKILRFAARQSGSTSALGNEQMTISMLKGEHGKQWHDLQMLVDWFRKHEKPDVVHLSNALLSGLAGYLKSELGCKIVCTLQDEDEWVDEMREPFRTETWKILSENAAHVDAFIAVSDYYADLIKNRMQIPAGKISVVPNSISSDFIRKKEKSVPNHVIGYMSKINSTFGADKLFDAFVQLKKDENFRDLKLMYSGGYTDDYKAIVAKINKESRRLGIESDIIFHDDLSYEGKKQFFDSISLLCVPSKRKEAFGMHILEAFAAEVPTVIPDIGAYPEIIVKSKAGICYDATDSNALFNTLKNVLSNHDEYGKLKNNCHNAILQIFSTENQSKLIAGIYSK